MKPETTKIILCISGIRHCVRHWSSVPRIAEDVFIEDMPDVSTARHGHQHIKVGGAGYLKVCAVLWDEDSVTVNLLGMKELS